MGHSIQGNQAPFFTPMNKHIHLCLIKKCESDECFREVMYSLFVAFTRLGFVVSSGDNLFRKDITNIVFGFWRQPNVVQNSIVYNLEPVTEKSINDGRVPIEALKRYRVWDYSPRNVLELKTVDVDDYLVEIGYVPEMTRFPKLEEDLDVVFFGALTPRRAAVLAELGRRGYRVYASARLYGAKRDHLVSRAKVVLNMHSSEDIKSFEIVRIAPSLANKKCIVTERAEGDWFPEDLRYGMWVAPYDKLVDACTTILDSFVLREEIAECGYNLFRKRDQVEILDKAIKEGALAA